MKTKTNDKHYEPLTDLKRLEYAIEVLSIRSGGKFSRTQAQVLMRIITKMIYEKTE